MIDKLLAMFTIIVQKLISHRETECLRLCLVPGKFEGKCK